MTKKRFKLSMAALGLLAAFFMVLIAMLLAPTLASADKNSGVSHDHGGTPDGGIPYSGSGGASHGSIFADNEPGHGHEYGYDTLFCANNIHACTDAGNADETHDGFNGSGDPQGGYGGDFSGGHKDGGGSSNGDGRYASNFWGGGAGGGGAGGGNGGGGGQGNGDNGNKGGDKTGTSQSDNPDSDDKTGPGDPDPEILTLDIPDDSPSDFVGSPFDDSPGDNGDNSGDGPKGDNPPVTQATVTEVPEPLTLSLFAIGLVGAGALRRRSRA
jgi:hypothetical protein